MTLTKRLARAVWKTPLPQCFLIAAVFLPSVALCGTMSVLHTFTGGPDGALPLAGPSITNSGSLYGETTHGGSGCYNCGTTYHLGGDGMFHTIVAFDGTKKGLGGQSSVAVSGNELFGSTTGGGQSGLGLVFKANTNGAQFTVLHNFAGNGDGANPRGNLLLDASGNLFGTASNTNGPSLLFEVKADGTYLHAHEFITTDGEYVPSSIIIDASGTIFGTTKVGADGCNLKGFKPPTECGAVYSYEPLTGVFTVLHNFKGHYDGAFPLLGGVNDNGTLFGAATAGGKYGLGTLFAIRKGATGYSYHKLHDFTGGADGGTPNQPYADIQGNITGTTQIDGVADGKTASGTLFSLPRAGTLTTLYTFTAVTGGTTPLGAVAPGGGGIFYGVTFGNGTTSCKLPDGSVINNTGCGTIWKYTP